MIIRRVLKHVRDQQWAAVFIDFVVVVVGIFVALQVDNWNENRKERIQERALLVRLHAETRTLLATTSAEYKVYRARGDALLSVNPVLFSQEPVRP